MKIHRLLWILFIAFALAPATAIAQLSVYALYSQQDTHYNTPSCFLSATCPTPAAPDADSKGGSTPGLGGGVMLDLFHRGWFHTGIDLRADGGSGKGQGGGTIGTKMVEASARFAFVSPEHRLSPYAGFGLGYASGHTTSSIDCLIGCTPGDGPIETASQAVYTLTLGLDIRLTDRVDIRLFDFSAAAGTLHTPPSTSFLIQPIDLSFGVVVRLRRQGRGTHY